LAQALEVLSQRLLELDRLDEALPHLREAAKIFAQLAEREEQARTLTIIAYVYERCGSDAAVALATWDQVRALWCEQGDQEHELEALEGMARVARDQRGDSSAALQYITRALDAAERIGDSTKQGSLLNSKGIIEFGRENYSAALESYEAALQLFHTCGDLVHAGLMLNSIGVTLNRMGRREEAVVQLELALELHRKSGQRLLEGHALAALGDVFNATGSPDRARHYYDASLEIRREIGDRKGEGWMLHHLAQLMILQDDAGQARVLLDRATAIAVDTGDRHLADACVRLIAQPEE
jgi:tetratricopeptide (TPR) repeat protein